MYVRFDALLPNFVEVKKIVSVSDTIKWYIKSQGKKKSLLVIYHITERKQKNSSIWYFIIIKHSLLNQTNFALFLLEVRNFYILSQLAVISSSSFLRKVVFTSADCKHQFSFSVIFLSKTKRKKNPQMPRYLKTVF